MKWRRSYMELREPVYVCVCICQVATSSCLSELCPCNTSHVNYFVSCSSPWQCRNFSVMDVLRKSLNFSIQASILYLKIQENSAETILRAHWMLTEFWKFPTTYLLWIKTLFISWKCRRLVVVILISNLFSFDRSASSHSMYAPRVMYRSSGVNECSLC
jgi:hypothetical protein